MKRKIIILILPLFFFLLATSVFALKSSDVDGNGVVNSQDIRLILENWLVKVSSVFDIDENLKVNSLDLGYVIKDFGKTLPTSTPYPTSPPSSSEWTQFGRDPQRTNYTSQTVATPWKYKWQWNGAGADGKKQVGHVTVPDLAQPITGGGRIYIVGNDQVYALSFQGNSDKTGNVLWFKGGLGSLSPGSPNYDSPGSKIGAGGTLAYDSPSAGQEFVYVASFNGNLYKLNAANGSVVATFSAGSPLNTSPLLVNDRVYVVSQAGVLYALDKVNLSKVWEYSAGSAGVMPPAYSSSRNLVVFGTKDLYVHAVNQDGSFKWREKPTVRNYAEYFSGMDGAQEVSMFERSWPVIADQHGIVFVRLWEEWDTVWAGPVTAQGTGMYPADNVAIHDFLSAEGNERLQVLFAMNLDNGSLAFIPNVGNGGAGDGGYEPTGPMPVIRIVDGNEVAYIPWRSSTACLQAGIPWCDGRWDSALGEMVLDNSHSIIGCDTANGVCNAGYLRFVKFEDPLITDETENYTMAGDIIFQGHWLSNMAARITNRNNNLGYDFAHPIQTVFAPYVIWAQATDYLGCNFNTSTRYCPNGLYTYTDSRSYQPGFYEYFGDRHQNSGDNPRPATIVSNGLVIVKSEDSAIIALENGNPTADAGSQQTQQAQAQNQSLVLGESVGNPPLINYLDAPDYISQYVTAVGTVKSAVDHLPKAIYLGFTNPHDGALLVRIFNKDLSKFNYDPMTLLGKKIQVTGKVTLYGPGGKDPEIIVTDPGQIKIIN